MIFDDQTFALIAVILILVDIFLPTDITTYIAYIIFSYLIAHNINVPILYQVIIGIIAWWAMVLLHYYFFKKHIKRFTDKFIAPTKIKSGISIHFGKIGQIKLIEDKLMIQIEDEIYPFSEQDNRQCKAGDKAIIIGYLDKNLIIKLNN